MAEERISAAVQETVKAAAIVGSNDLAFHRNLDADFSTSLDSCLKRLLGLTTSLLSYAIEGEYDSLRDSDDVNARWGEMIDVVDSLLEQTDASLEELTSKNKKEQEAAAIQQSSKVEKEPLPANLRNAQDLPHPQLKFRQKPDNTDQPWSPILSQKVNAKISLEQSLNRPMASDDDIRRIGHPYAYEIETIEYPDFVFQEQEPIQPQDVDSTSAIWVDTEEKLQQMLEELRKSQEIAVDLEHHDFHSFRGFVCLMQVSNRHQDWIVDTLVLREELSVLNEVFTDPKILKVFHGANSDIVWLQRDFGLYIVNLFDTYHASKVLGLEGHGLAFLLSTYVKFEADKRYQLADWRIRPLPKEMLYYARSDTHYLLYVYDMMRNELLQKSNQSSHNVVASVLQASAEVSLRQYSKEPYDAAGGQGSDGWQFVLNRFYGTRAFGPQQLEVLKALHQWRDQKAREKDESTRFILPNQAIVSIAAAMPKDLNALLTTCKHVSSTMQANLKSILKVIELAIRHADAELVAEPKPKAITANERLVAVPQKVKAPRAAPSSSVVDLESLISTHSVFWGSLVKDMKTKYIQSPLHDLQLALPLPALSSQIYENDTVAKETSLSSTVAPETRIDAPSNHDVFIVKDVAKMQTAKRKLEVIDQESLQPDAEEINAKREARQRAKQAKIEARAASNIEAKEDVVPFDYAAQPSILKDREQKKTKAKKFGEFAGKIVRSKQIQGGKQTTFKR